MIYENEYHASENVVEATDQRLLLMQEYVALDREHKRLNNERKMLEERSHKLGSELQRVREQLRDCIDEPVAAMKRDVDAEFGVRR